MRGGERAASAKVRERILRAKKRTVCLRKQAREKLKAMELGKGELRRKRRGGGGVCPAPFQKAKREWKHYYQKETKVKG